MALAAGMAEVALRIGGWRISPVRFVLPSRPGDDWRLYHAGGYEPGVTDRAPLTTFDPVLFWRFVPRAVPELNDQGFRGASLRARKGPREFLILAIGDSNTAGRLDTPDHWPGCLQDLVDLNPGPREVRIVNAGVYGYSSFQGLRMFERLLDYRPDLAYFSFGVNDAHMVATADAEYARRFASLGRWDWSRLALPIAEMAWHARDARRAALTARVPLEDYRRNLETFVTLVRARGVRPVLLTRPVAASGAEWSRRMPDYNKAVREVAARLGAEMVDVEEAFRGSRTDFADAAHLDRRGLQRMASLLFEVLEADGIVPGDRRHASSVDLGLASDRRPELGEGWWAAEPWGTGQLAGRWTRGEGTVMLERGGDEDTLEVEMDLQSPTNSNAGTIAVNGEVAATFEGPNRHLRERIDVGGVSGRVLTVKFTSSPFIPSQLDPGSRDTRLLGVFVRHVGLVVARPAAGVR
jgi:lysophospholipase L1-like esterase